MAFNDVQMKRVSGSVPYFGAIFMSNRSTKEECFAGNLFGLPLEMAEFVKKVKSGMILFLFEHEQRKLYGVFEALSDGAMNIVPDAYRSSGKRFPAQVRFRRIWNCHSLSENEFRQAIADNYYAAYKFKFGLSEIQVHRLLCLFDSTKVRIQKYLKDTKKHSESLDRLYPVVKSGEHYLERNDSIVESELKLLDPGISDFHHPAVCGTNSSWNDTLSGLEDYIPLLSDSSNSDFDCSDAEDLEMSQIECPLAASIPDGGSYEGSHQRIVDDYPMVKGLYSDTRDKRTSVFSRLNLVSNDDAKENDVISDNPKKKKIPFSPLDLIVQESEDNSERDESVHEIMEKLRQKHGDRERKTMTKINVRGSAENSPNKRVTVFDRLNNTREATKPKKEVNSVFSRLIFSSKATAYVREGIMKEMPQGEKRRKKREREAFFINTKIQVETIDDASAVEENLEYTGSRERVEMQTSTFNFTCNDDMLKTQSETEERDCDHGVLNLCVSDNQHRKKSSRPSFSDDESSHVKTVVCESHFSMQLPSQESSADKPNCESSEVTVKMERVDDDGIGSTHQDNQVLVDEGKLECSKAIIGTDGGERSGEENGPHEQEAFPVLCGNDNIQGNGVC